MALLAVAALGASPASAQPSFTKGFPTGIIGPGSTTTLQFNISNIPMVTPATEEMAFTDILPAGLTVAEAPGITNSCDGAVTAAPGSSTITFTGGRLPANAECFITVNVTAGGDGSYVNTTSALTSTAGSSPPATATLMVSSASELGFTKAFTPSTVSVGEVSTLTFTLSNDTGADVFGVSFRDRLPSGLVIASPANASQTCTAGNLSAAAGGDFINFILGFLVNGETCTVSVDVVPSTLGRKENLSSEISRNGDLTGGRASDALVVESMASGDILLSKLFSPASAVPGETVTLQLTLRNPSRADSVSDISFTDDLDAALSGLLAVSPSQSDICGAGSQISGTSTLTFTGGNLPAGGECTFGVQVQVPGGALAGDYTNTTSPVSGMVGGAAASGSAASANLNVRTAPFLEKTIPDSPALAGGTATLRFTITNTDPINGASSIAFRDDLSAFVAGSFPTLLPGGFCGGGSTMSFIDTNGDATGDTLQIFNASLGAGASCTFDVPLNLGASTPNGTYLNRAGPVTAVVGGVSVTGNTAEATLAVIAAPDLSKQFLGNPAQPGDMISLELTLSLSPEAPGGASGISFTDDLGAALTGLMATGLPLNDVCGTGSQISGTTVLSFSGGSLAPGDSCTFSVDLQVPVGAAPGTYTNTTSSVTATVQGEEVTGPGGTDELQIINLLFTKSFVDDPVAPGASVDLQFTIQNLSSDPATGLTFTDDLSATLAGLGYGGGTVSDVCGAGSQLLGTTTLILAGGNLPAGGSCSFTVTLDVPGGASPGSYGNTTSSLTGMVGGNAVSVPPAQDDLLVVDPLALTKTFTDDPVAAGGTVTLEFTLENFTGSDTITGIAFTDDLDAALSGLVSTSGTQNDLCGMGSQLSGTSTLTFTGGSLAPGTSCTFSVTLQVPAGAAPGTVATNTTSTVSSSAGTAPAASDDLEVESLLFTKAFSGPSVAGGTPTLTFTLENLSASPIASLGFTDDLDAALAGLVATGLPMSDVCGMGSQISGISFLTFTGGSLGGGESCTIAVDLQVPAGAAPGTYSNTSSDLFSSGLPVAGPATDDLAIEPPPTFAKTFTPDFIAVGGTSTLSFEIDNSASAVAAGDLGFIDNLPAGVQVAATPNLSNTCGGTVTAAAGSGVISLSAGTVGAGATCLVQVTVTATTSGAFVNTTGDLTSSSGNSGTASDTLNANDPPGFAKAFAPTDIPAGGTSVLTFTIDNAGSTAAATDLAFTDNLPAGVSVATPGNPSTTCTGGTLTAADGSGTITYSGGTVAAGASCTVQVTVTAASAGTYVNTSGPLTSSLGSSGTASDTLNVAMTPLFTKAFAPATILTGTTSTLTFTIDNGAGALPATGLTFTDNLPAGLEVEDPASIVNGCGGTVTAAPGSSAISLAGGSVAAGASCQILVDVTGDTVGSYTNTSGPLTSSLGSSGTATDTLEIAFLGFSKAFDPDPAMAGMTVTLVFTLENPSATSAATDIAFTDDLDAFLPGTVAVGLPESDVCGTGSQLSGTSVITFTGGSLGPGATCMFPVTLQLPDLLTDGTFTNTTSPVTAQVDGMMVTGGPASAAEADLTVTDNVPPTDIPTQGTWGLLALMGLLGLAGMGFLRRVG